MPAQWAGCIVGEMHNAKITAKQLAEHMGLTKEYVSMVLNGHRNPAGAEERFRKAVDELIKEKETTANEGGQTNE